MRALADLMGELGRRDEQISSLKRILAILKVAVAQIDILETMTPLEFMTFRERLESASGFQSLQFRELEFALGAKRRAVLDHLPEGSAQRRRLEQPHLPGGIDLRQHDLPAVA